MSTTLPTDAPFTLLVDTGGRPYTLRGDAQFAVPFQRESRAWAAFWDHVSAMADDGEEMSGFDTSRVLASRTGLNPKSGAPWSGSRWYVHLMRKVS